MIYMTPIEAADLPKQTIPEDDTSEDDQADKIVLHGPSKDLSSISLAEMYTPITRVVFLYEHGSIKESCNHNRITYRCISSIGLFKFVRV